MISLRAAALTAAILLTSACADSGDGNQAAGGNGGEGQQAADGQTIAAGLNQNGRFFAAAKAAGLDGTLSGPGPYTVLAPNDAAFGKLPDGTVDNWLKPENRAQLTSVLTYHILPGTVLAEDIGKAIDNAKGKAVLATMGGGTITATREGGKVVLTDSAGGKAIVTGADQKRSNGVVHEVDAVLSPAQS